MTGLSRRGRVTAHAVEEIDELLKRADYVALKECIARCDAEALAREWRRFQLIEKAVIFKLMEPPSAMKFYGILDPAEKYFLICAFDPGSIAPVLENAPPEIRTLFHRLPQDCYDAMIRQI